MSTNDPSPMPTSKPSFTEAPTVADAWGSAGLREGPGTQIGPYKLLSRIGEGGFGVVFMAEQERPIRRRVALKVVKVGMDTHQVVARFEQERQALALMDHPNIAKVLDAGATEAGRPYFVMELCAGEPITAYCDHHKLTVSQRLEIFVQVCRAVQHAHLKGIIHRDIKPGNVMVSTHEGAPLVKVIDFGIAKAAMGPLTDRTIFTEHRQFVGTPEYMSPEQAAGSLDVDTRTDVYSLGVVLYQLLSGHTPFDGKELRSAAYEELQRIIREVDPPIPSARLSRSMDSAATTAASRLSDPRKLTSTIRGELDWIVMRAMEKDRSRRYESASALAADVSKYLAGQPVTAAPPSAAYRVRKFVRRNRGGVLAAALVACALLAGAVGTAFGFVRASRERDEAQHARDEAEAAATFLSDALAAADPGRMGKDVTVREIIDRASAKLGPAITAKPRLEAKLRETIARTYLALGDFAAAERNVISARDLSLKLGGPDDEHTLRNEELRGRIVYSLGKYGDAEKILLDVADRATKKFGPGNTVALAARNDLASVYGESGRSPDAEAMTRLVVDGLTRSLGPEHEETLGAMSNLAVHLATNGKYEEADALFARTIEATRRVLGPEHPGTLSTMSNHAWTFNERSRWEDSVKLGEQVFAIRTRVLGPEHRETLDTENNLAVAYRALGRNEEAEKHYLHNFEVVTRTLGAEHPATIVTQANIAKFYMETGHLEKAEPIFIDCEAVHRKVLGLEHIGTAQTILGHGICLSKMKRDAEAESKLREAFPILSKVAGPTSPATRRAAQELVIVLDRSGKAADAAEWRATVEKIKPAKP